MCGRYYLDDDDSEELLQEYIQEAERRALREGLPLVRRGEARPTNIVPVLAPGAARRQTGGFPMRWGFPHPAHPVLVFNTRSETADQKPLFCTSIQDRRCLVPASGYFEWKKTEGGKTKYVFRKRDATTLYLAGLYLRSSRTDIPCFTILTRDAMDGMREIHGRMPVIVPRERMGDWLSGKGEYAELLAEMGDAELTAAEAAR